MIDSVKQSLLNTINNNYPNIEKKTLFEVILITMELVERYKYLSGSEKKEYCRNIVLTLFNETDPIMVDAIIESAIQLTKGFYNINQKKGLFSNLWCLKTSN